MAASSSAVRLLKERTLPLSIRAYSKSASLKDEQPYIRSPRPYARESWNVSDEPVRRPRPAEPTHFTARPELQSRMALLRTLLTSTEKALRAIHVYPLPRHLSLPEPPKVGWKTPMQLQRMIAGPALRMTPYRHLTTLLNEVHKMAYMAELGGKPELAATVRRALAQFTRPSDDGGRKKELKEKSGPDEFGRFVATGKRKAAMAQVWIIPSQLARSMLDASPVSLAEDDKPVKVDGAGGFLVNHLPLPVHFTKPHDRELILRPLRLTGLLGAYNVFAQTQGGGPTGQAGAIALALARALVLAREDTKDILMAANALKRDGRVTERKKTNRVKARKSRTWVKR